MTRFSKQSADLTVDPRAPLAGINGIEPIWENIWFNKQIVDPRTTRAIFETFMKDQHGNYYLSYTTRLKDRETYQVGEWIPPSQIALFGGFCVEFFDAMRRKAFLAFSETEAKL